VKGEEMADVEDKVKKVKDGIKKPEKKSEDYKLEKSSGSQKGRPKKTSPEEKTFKTSFEDPMKKRMNEGRFNPGGYQPSNKFGVDAPAIIRGDLVDASAQERLPWDAPDKEMYRGRFFAPEDLKTPIRELPGRRPESLGLPPVPKRGEGSALPLGNPESLFRPETLQKYQGSMPPAGTSLPDERISQPPAPAPRPATGAPASEPNWNFLDKFREGLAPAAGGAASWDPAYNPENNVSSWQKDEEASAYENRRAMNAEKEDWWAGQTPEQIKANLIEAARQQGDAGMRNIDPNAWKQKLMQRRMK
jgi:hypothetical protein